MFFSSPLSPPPPPDHEFKYEDGLSYFEVQELTDKDGAPVIVSKRILPILLRWDSETRWQDPIYVDPFDQKWITQWDKKTAPKMVWARFHNDCYYREDGTLYYRDVISETFIPNKAEYIRAPRSKKEEESQVTENAFNQQLSEFQPTSHVLDHSQNLMTSHEIKIEPPAVTPS